MTARRSLDGSSVLSTDDLADYDVISSDGQRSLESSIADLGRVEDRIAEDVYEPPPTQTARENFYTPALSVEDIQDHVKRTIAAGGAGFREHGSGSDVDRRVVRVYVDGKFDGFNIGHALQLRQAKLSFPLVHLMVGVYADSVCDHHESPATTPHLERCELVRHCRWVDEVVPEAPWTLDEIFMRARRIDYVAYDEGTSVDPAFDKDRLKGYDLVKSLRKTIPTRRTTGMAIAVAERSKNQTPIPSRQGTLRGAPSSLKHEARESRRGIPTREVAFQADAEEKPELPESEPEEPKVDEFGTGVGV